MFCFVLFCFVLFVLFSFIKSSFAITPNIDNNYNFGTFTQTNSNASFVLSYDGIMSSISNLSQSGTPTAGKITYSTEKNGDNITFNIIFFHKNLTMYFFYFIKAILF